MSALPSLDFLHRLGGAIVVTNREGQISHWSAGAQQLLGFSSEEMRSRNWWETFPLAIRTQIDAAFAEQKPFRSFLGACVTKSGLGNLIPLAVSITSLSNDHAAADAVLTVCHKLPEKLSGPIVGPLGPASIALKQDEEILFQVRKAQTVGKLANGLAHDFNNIFTTGFAHLDLLTSAPGLPKDLLLHATRSRTSAARTAELVSRLMAFIRRSPPILGPLQLPPLLDEVFSALQQSIDSSIQVRRPSPAADLWTVQADAVQLKQAAINLCLSARDAMPKGGPLVVDVANVVLGEAAANPPRRAGEFVRLSISNSGQQRATEAFTRITEPRFTGEEFGKGPALGLSIAHCIVTEHGGWMEVETELGKGTRFHAYLPRSHS